MIVLTNKISLFEKIPICIKKLYLIWNQNLSDIRIGRTCKYNEKNRKPLNAQWVTVIIHEPPCTCGIATLLIYSWIYGVFVTIDMHACLIRIILGHCVYVFKLKVWLSFRSGDLYELVARGGGCLAVSKPLEHMPKVMSRSHLYICPRCWLVSRLRRTK